MYSGLPLDLAPPKLDLIGGQVFLQRDDTCIWRLLGLVPDVKSFMREACLITERTYNTEITVLHFI